MHRFIGGTSVPRSSQGTSCLASLESRLGILIYGAIKAIVKKERRRAKDGKPTLRGFVIRYESSRRPLFLGKMRRGEAVKESVLLIGSIVVLVVIIPFVWGAVYAMGGE